MTQLNLLYKIQVRFDKLMFNSNAELTQEELKIEGMLRVTNCTWHLNLERKRETSKKKNTRNERGNSGYRYLRKKGVWSGWKPLKTNDKNFKPDIGSRLPRVRFQNFQWLSSVEVRPREKQIQARESIWHVGGFVARLHWCNRCDRYERVKAHYKKGVIVHFFIYRSHPNPKYLIFGSSFHFLCQWLMLFPV